MITTYCIERNADDPDIKRLVRVRKTSDVRQMRKSDPVQLLFTKKKSPNRTNVEMPEKPH